MTDDDAKSLAAALEKGLLPSFPERAVTAAALAELVLDATESALALSRGGPARPALEALELLATRLDLYEWDGPPGWDEVLARGLGPRATIAPRASVLDGLGEKRDRAGQLAAAHARARDEAAFLLSLGRHA